MRTKTIKRQIRKGLFETNSSSVHTLTINRSGLRESYLTIDEDGYINVPFLNVENEDTRILTDQEEKLSYLLTCCWYLVQSDRKWEETTFFDSYRFEHIENAVCKQTKAKGIRLKEGPKPRLPEECIPEYDFPYINEWDEDDINNFIFNDYINIIPISNSQMIIDPSGQEPNNMRVYKKDNCIKVHYGSFDKYTETFDTQAEKLSYLMTCCWYLAGRPGDVETVYSSSYYEYIKNAVCKYAGCDTIKIIGNEEPYIDHQSAPYDGIELVDIYDENAIIDFVFNKHIALHTESD